MRKNFISSFVFLFLISFCCLGFVSPSIDDEFKKFANYATEYETGNINYIQLLVYSSSIREEINSLTGSANNGMDGMLKEEQLQSLLGKPTEKTRWVWSEREQREVKMDREVPAWRKIIFDGKKIQIRLTSWPSIFGKKEFKDAADNDEEKKRILEELEGKLVYHLNFEIEFKKPGEQMDIQEKIEDIRVLAETFNSNPSNENAQALAMESVSVEKSFESYFRQSGEDCENIMSSIFGTENKRQTQNMFVQEISFCEGDNFEVIGRLEMCDDCEWNWINLDFWVEGRGPGFKMKEEKMENLPSWEQFKNLDNSEFEEKITGIVNEVKVSCETGDFGNIMSTKSKLQPLNEAWAQKSNDLWKDVDAIFKAKVDSMNQEERQKFDQSYGWIKQEQERRKMVRDLSRANYEERKLFYINLFSNYEKREYSFTQVEFQKRLVEEFKEKGREICNNNVDDNENSAIDCADEQCGGKICGKGTNTIQSENGTQEVEVNFYCIEKECKAREEISLEIRNISFVCQELPPIECPQGSKAFFSRYDNETNCPIETSCLEETTSCTVKEDCSQSACGITECIDGKCEVTGLTECKEKECVEGDEKICDAGGVIVEICNNGFWEKVGECNTIVGIKDDSIVGDECVSASDCGENNICNNGVCQLIPQVIVTSPTGESIEEESSMEEEKSIEETSETEETQLEEQTSEQEIINSEPEEVENEEPAQTEDIQEEITGSVIFRFIVPLFSRFTGFAVEGEETPKEEVSSDSQISVESIVVNEDFEDNSNQEENTQNQNDDNNQESEDERRQNEEKERRERDEERREREEEQRMRENKDRCAKDCVRPCVEQCIREKCGEKFECDVNEMQKECEGSCKAEDNCIEKCLNGGNWWEEVFGENDKNKDKEEKGVFQVGGTCRTSEGKTEAFIWFGGWGEQFNQIQQMKNKYYSGGQADWCKKDMENLMRQREEFEKGFNQEFAVWFFEKYLANSAENWEQSVSGIYELYWKDVDNAREIAYRMQCLETEELPDINLINITYKTGYGGIEFWEEIKSVKLEGMDKEVQIISPYMKVWVFPPKEFMIYEMKKAMRDHKFPGSSKDNTDRKNEEGLKEEEKAIIKQNEDLMNKIREISEKYGGNVDTVIQLKDYETNETIFNLYAQMNEEDIVKVEPMLPEEVPSQDIKIELDFDVLYNLIHDAEKEMSGERIESPPWDKKGMGAMGTMNQVKEGIQIFFKVRELINSAKVTPPEAKKDLMSLLRKFMYMMIKEGGNSGGDSSKGDSSEEVDEKLNKLEQELLGSKEQITGEAILS